MKRIVVLTCIGSLALALTALGGPKSAPRSAGGRGAPNAHAGGGHFAPMRGGGGHSFARAGAFRGGRVAAPRMRSAPAMHRGGPARTFAHGRTTVNRQRTVARANTMRANKMEAARARNTRNLARANALQRNRAEAEKIRGGRNVAGTQRMQTGRTEAARTRAAQNAAANVKATAGRNLAVNRQRNLTFAHNVAANRAGNTRITNYWHSAPFNGANYSAFYNYNQTWHDSGWWVNNYPWIVYAYPLGGWWYWNANYWYPAWGYDPYGYYPYNGPIYSYGNLTPDQIVVNVQLALQQQGYYAGPADGILGSQTRGALAAFQADNGLAVTSAVDRPTLQSLGLA